MFKVNKGIAPHIFANIFNTRNNMKNFTKPLVNFVYIKLETIFFWDQKYGKEKLEAFKYPLKN